MSAAPPRSAIRDRPLPDARPHARSRDAHPLSPPAAGGPAAAPPTRKGARLAAFAALSAFAADRYAALVLRPPAVRVAGAVAIAVALAGLLVLLGARADVDAPPGRRRVALAVVVTLLAALAAMVVLGVPATLLWPGHWGRLRGDLGRGFSGLAGNLWPYRGTRTWVRLAVLLGLVVTLVPAAALAFWPARAHAAGRRNLALGVLLGVYLTAAANQPADSWLAQGVLLLALLIAWVWLPRVPRRDGVRAAVWLTTAAVAAIGVSSGLRGAQPWLDYRAWQPFGVATPRLSFQWDSLYGPLTWPASGAVMFDVTAQRPELWQITSLDRFDGVRFLRSDDPPATPSQPPPNLPGQTGYEMQTFDIVGLESDVLPAAGQAVDVETLRSGPGPPPEPGPDGTITESLPGLQDGDAYTVTSYVAHPTPAQMRGAGNSFSPAYLPYTDFDLPTATQTGVQPGNLGASASEPLLTVQTIGSPAPGRAPATVAGDAARILASPYGPMFRLARRLAAGEPSTYDVAERISAYLHDHYAYSTSPPVRRYPLEAFLFEDRVGYCQQFAGAMTLMLRMDGIPAREAVGFLPGRYDSATGAFVVTARDAHAWVQVYLDGVGWVTFDPTPATTQTRAPAAIARVSAAALAAAGAKTPARHQLPPGGSSATQRRTATHGHLLSLLLELAALALVAAALLAAILALGARRLRRSLHGEADGAVAELRRGLRLLGYPLTSATTLAQLQRRLELTHGPQAGVYPALLRARRFAPAVEGTANGALDGARERRALRRALVSGGGIWARAVALVAFPPAAPRSSDQRRRHRRTQTGA